MKDKSVRNEIGNGKNGLVDTGFDSRDQGMVNLCTKLLLSYNPINGSQIKTSLVLYYSMMTNPPIA